MSETTKKNETLEKYGINITEKAINGEIDKIYGREKELDDMIKILSRKKKNNVIMVGHPGCVLPTTKIVIKKISEECNHEIIETDI